VTSANRPVLRVNPIVAPTLPEPAPPAVAPPAPQPAPPAPTRKKEEDEDEDKPIARTAPPAAAPRQVAPSAAPSTVAPLQMAPVPRPASPSGAPPGAAGGANRPPPPGGANGDFTVRPSGQVGGGLRGALRQTVGCENRNAVALNKGERNTCDERAGERGANAPVMAVGTELSREKRGRMQTQAEINEAMRTYKAGAATSGSTPQGQGAAAPRVRDLVGGR
jgi:hypothetical protein